MVIKYLTVSSDNVAADAALLEDIGFDCWARFYLGPNEQCQLYVHTTQEIHLALVSFTNPSGDLVVLNTKSCIKSYNALIRSGVKCISPPRDLNLLVMAEFITARSVRLILIEECQTGKI